MAGRAGDVIKKTALDSWQVRRDREIAEFIEGWDWDRVIWSWKRRIDDFSISLDPLFVDIWVHDPKHPVGREVALSWWLISEIRERQTDFQRHLDRLPGTIGPINPYGILQGALNTLDYLWKNRDDLAKLAAVLIDASLFSKLHSGRIDYPRDNWPSYDCVDVLSRWAHEKWSDQNGYRAWEHYHTETLPVMSYDYCYHINDMKALVRYLAEEHASLLLQYRPVAIVFKNDRDPFINNILQKEYELERKKM